MQRTLHAAREVTLRDLVPFQRIFAFPSWAANAVQTACGACSEGLAACREYHLLRSRRIPHGKAIKEAVRYRG